MYTENKPYIFVSYAHLDSDIVLPIIEKLSAKGFNIWYDSGIEAGSEWPEYIAEKLLNCDVAMVFLSENALASQNCKQEIRYAISKNKNLLCIHLENLQLSPGMEMQLAPLQAMFRFRYKDEADFISALTNAMILRNCLIEAPSEVEASAKKVSTSELEASSEDVTASEIKISSEEKPQQKKPQKTAITEDTAMAAFQKIADNIVAAMNGEGVTLSSENESEETCREQLLIERAVNTYLEKHTGPERPVSFRRQNELSKRVLRNAVEYVAGNKISADDIIYFYDSTIACSGKEGLILTRDHLYLYYLKKYYVFDYCDILSAEEDTDASGKIRLTLRSKETFSILICGRNTEMIQFFNAVSEVFEEKSREKSYDSATDVINAVNFANSVAAETSKYTRINFSFCVSENQKLNAIKRYAPDIKPEEIIALFDETIGESGKKGFFLTENKFYCSYLSEPVSIRKIQSADGMSSLIIHFNDNSEAVAFTPSYTKEIYLPLLQYFAELYS